MQEVFSRVAPFFERRARIEPQTAVHFLRPVARDATGFENGADVGFEIDRVGGRRVGGHASGV